MTVFGGGLRKRGWEGGRVKSGGERLERFLGRAAAGEELTLGFFGGSITQGSLASSRETCYAYLVYQGLAERFPQAVFHYVNAGIGGTGSYFGVMRIWDELLMFRPDLVVVDFAVNDLETALPLYVAGETEQRGTRVWNGDKSISGERSFCSETFEAVLRRILAAEKAPAVLILNNAFYDTGASAEEDHNRIADHYGIPHVSVRDTLIPRIRKGEFHRSELSPDGLHPNDLGHALIAGELLNVLDSPAYKPQEKKLFSETADWHDGRNLAADQSERQADPADEGGHQLPMPLTDNGYEGIRRFTIANCAPLLRGFRADCEEKLGHLDFFRNGWIGTRIGDRLSLDLEGGNLAVVYRRTVRRPAPKACLTLDGNSRETMILDGNFDQDWGDCLYLQPILRNGGPGRHRVEIEIVEATTEDLTPFYLLCFGAEGA